MREGWSLLVRNKGQSSSCKLIELVELLYRNLFILSSLPLMLIRTLS